MSHPAAWADQLRAINQAFALREGELLAQLSSAVSELESLRARVTELANQQAESDRLRDEQEAVFNAALAAGRAERFETESRRLEEQFLARQKEHELKIKAECRARLDTTEQTFRDELGSLQVELSDVEQRKAESEIALRADLVLFQEQAVAQGRAQQEMRIQREQEITAQWVAMQSQFDRSRTADAVRHHERLSSMETAHLERERAWGLLSASLTAELRDRIENERMFSSRVQEALQDATKKLTEINRSVLSKLISRFRERR